MWDTLKEPDRTNVVNNSTRQYERTSVKKKFLICFPMCSPLLYIKYIRLTTARLGCSASLVVVFSTDHFCARESCEKAERDSKDVGQLRKNTFRWKAG